MLSTTRSPLKINRLIFLTGTALQRLVNGPPVGYNRAPPRVYLLPLWAPRRTSNAKQCLGDFHGQRYSQSDAVIFAGEVRLIVHLSIIYFTPIHHRFQSLALLPVPPRSSSRASPFYNFRPKFPDRKWPRGLRERCQWHRRKDAVLRLAR